MLRIASEPIEQLLTEWTSEVDIILSALDAGRAPAFERRHEPRVPHRALARLRLFTMSDGEAPRLLFTRDVDPRGFGFITQVPVPLGYGGVVLIHAPSDELLEAGCIISRCRPCTHGWYEGALTFNRRQKAFEVVRASTGADAPNRFKAPRAHARP